ncbi:MAG: 23S rRNA (adenine(2503)-C(2))-methyltransferase RlmN [Flavobacteriaceae bacterium]|nr:23S rRNA (adenine(2503)-C(2))-methyltransferase RlmN [Flavobacteriaceae bacterium]|tara:strand:- start:21598 stop:22659 length:1062 start_codon:yes stop_codon:yes gene_type:complete
MKIKSKIDIRALSSKELESFFLDIGEPLYRVKQVEKWLWQKGISSFDQMKNISKFTRKILEENFVINNIKVEYHQKSKDGTIKNSIRLFDGLKIESVLIPTENRITACISSQVGCSLDCKFCATSRLKRLRNLNPDEIFDQVLLINMQAKKYYNKSLTNIVFMGMGEPLMNYNNVVKAINKISAVDGLGISLKKITLSTSGIPKMIKKLADDKVKFQLAVSLHSARQSIREKIMPFTVNFPLNELKDSLEYWYSKTKKRVTYEYIIWKDINDKDEDIKSLVEFCSYIPSKVNFIEYNNIGSDDFLSVSYNKILSYQDALKRANITSTIRKSRGEDISAACGQLANNISRNSKY